MRFFNGGYLSLQKICTESGFKSIYKGISSRLQFDYDLERILRMLFYGRILFPKSKLATLDEANKLLEVPEFQLYDVHRALSVFADENDFIQS